jgi:orotidine-5'-phosphate decarboxylase
MNFISKLISVSRTNKSLLCIGLDTDYNKLPESIKSVNNPVLEFNSRIINATKDLVCAYKINFAFYESLGTRGWEIIEKTLEMIPKDVITIADAKRGDIGNTSSLYARAFFEYFNFDAVTVNPFLGHDSVQPFLEYKDKGIFILTLTSNPGSKDFQYLKINENPLYLIILEKILEWNNNNNCCLVVGATHPEELLSIRAKAPALPILIPGIGAQGGDLKSTIQAGCGSDNELILINLSRAVLYASKDSNFAEEAAKVASSYKDQIIQILKVQKNV